MSNIPILSLPILIESPSAVLGQMLSPHRGKSSETMGSFDVANNTNNNHGRCFQNSNGFNDFLLVHLCKVNGKFLQVYTLDF